MNKKSIILIIFLILLGVVIFIGYYSSFFPFLKYGLFSKPVTKVVFSIDDFSVDPSDPRFFTEVTKIVKEKWHQDARLATVYANLRSNNINYQILFFNDSHLFQYKNQEIPSSLWVGYNIEVLITQPASDYYFIPDSLNTFLRPFLYDNFYGLWKIYDKISPINIHVKTHLLEVSKNNKNLVGISCIDENICGMMSYNIPNNINPDDIKISGKELYKIISALLDTRDIDSSTEQPFVFSLRQSYRDKETEEVKYTDFPFWSIAGRRINAITGEAPEF